MISRKTFFGGLTAATLLALAACGGGGAAGGGVATGGASEADSTPGAARFRVVCGVCHGRNGDNGDAPNVRDLHWDAAGMRAQIRSGSGRMRPIPVTRLSDVDLEQVLVFMGTIGSVQ